MVFARKLLSQTPYSLLTGTCQSYLSPSFGLFVVGVRILVIKRPFLDLTLIIRELCIQKLMCMPQGQAIFVLSCKLTHLNSFENYGKMKGEQQLAFVKG